MTLLLLTLFAGLCVFLLGWGMLKPGRVCEFPFLAGATFAGSILPQAVGLTYSELGSPAGIDSALLMSILCAGSCYLGYVVSHTPMSALRWEFDTNRLLVVSALLSAIGGFFFLLTSSLPDELVSGEGLNERGGWSGQPVAYIFLAQVLRYGFAIALVLYAKMRSKLALVIIIFNCVILFEWIVIRGRRFLAIEFALFFLCAFWFVQRKALPRWGMLVMLAAGTLGASSVGVYRGIVYQDQAYGSGLRSEMPWGEIFKIDFIDVFITTNREESYDFRNLAYAIRVTETFDGGLSYWNDFVNTTVPAQVFGHEFKNSLQFDLPGEVFDPDSAGGSCVTGMGDSFQAFGWFGCLVFFLIAFSMRKIYETAQSGHLAAQVVYMAIITSILVGITHHTKHFVYIWVHMAMFLFPCLLWARKPISVQRPETYG